MVTGPTNALSLLMATSAAAQMGDPVSAAATLESLAMEPNLELAVLFDAGGEVLAVYRREGSQAAEPALPGSALDMSGLLDAPAGRHGFLTVRGDRFVFEDGTEARFWGGNLFGEANFPDKANAERLADIAAAILVLVSLCLVGSALAQDPGNPYVNNIGIYLNPAATGSCAGMPAPCSTTASAGATSSRRSSPRR